MIAHAWGISKVGAAVWLIISLLAPWWAIWPTLRLLGSFPAAMVGLMLAILLLWIVLRPVRSVGSGPFLAMGAVASIVVLGLSYALLMLVLVLGCAQDGCKGMWP